MLGGEEEPLPEGAQSRAGFADDYYFADMGLRMAADVIENPEVIVADEGYQTLSVSSALLNGLLSDLEGVSNTIVIRGSFTALPEMTATSGFQILSYEAGGGDHYIYTSIVTDFDADTLWARAEGYSYDSGTEDEFESEPTTPTISNAFSSPVEFCIAVNAHPDELAISINGGDAAFEAWGPTLPAIDSITLLKFGADANVFSDVTITDLVVYPLQLKTDLPALSAL